MMDFEVSKKAAKRRRQRLRRKNKSLENSLKVLDDSKVEPERQQIQQEEEMKNSGEKSKEQILADRQVKKASKQGKKNDPPAASRTIATGDKPNDVPKSQPAVNPNVKNKDLNDESSENNREQIHAEREARKLEKQQAKKKVAGPTTAVTEKVVQAKPSVNAADKKPETKPVVAKTTSDADLAVKMEKLHIIDDETKLKPATKAERRAKQEEQRAAKAKSLVEKNLVKKPTKTLKETPPKASQESKPSAPSANPHKAVGNSTQLKVPAMHKVKLFKHLYSDKCDLNINVNQKLNPAIVKLGLQYASDSIVGSNARCYAFLNAMKILINDYETPREKEFSRGLEAEVQPAVEFLQNCRPLAVSMTNALKHIKVLISQESSTTDNDDDKKLRLVEKIDTYANEQMEMAAIAISIKVREKISNGDVILTYGCSSLIKRTLIEACKDSELKFKVIVVDSRPDHEGQEMLKSLTMLGINCSYVLINAVSFVMPEVSKVLLGAHALLANGYVMSRCGTAQIALVAKSYNVPVLVCCETHKFSERVQTDAFVFNEIGDPNALVKNKNSRVLSDDLKDWESIPHLTPLNLRYDITPPELVTAVVTEVAILPCTSVQVILRVKPAE